MDLCVTFLDDCNSAEEYITKKSNAAKRLKAHGVAISDQLVGMLLLMGLPDDYYRPMKMALRNSVTIITTELAKKSILEEAKQKKDAESRDAHGLYSRASHQGFRRANNNYTRSKATNRPKCHRCGKFGHYAKDCKSMAPTRRPTRATYAMEEHEDDDDEKMIHTTMIMVMYESLQTCVPSLLSLPRISILMKNFHPQCG